jgi:uncharacterized protein (TIGR02145 family)/uncharacterized repeat protein (TIGR02543 family)
MVYMLKKLLTTACLSILTLGFILFHCSLPEPPPGPDEAKVSLLLKSSNGIIDRTGSIQDSVGKEVQIGIVLYLTQYIDSSVVRVILDSDTVRTLPWAFKKNMVDTVFFPLTFTKAGTHKVEVTSFITDQPNNVAEGKIIIYGPLQENKKPELKVPGALSAVVGKTITFSVSASDPDAGQIVKTSAPQKPENATFTADTFRWTPAIKDTGMIKVVFVATDNGIPVLTATDSVTIFVSATQVNHAPQWTDKNIQRTVKVGALFSYDLNNICSDPDNEKLTFFLISAPPANDTIIGSVYSFKPIAADTGKHTVHIFAKDSAGLTDTLTLGLTVSVTDVPDSVAPVIKFQSPSKDTIISADSFEVKVTCLDDSGCAVKGFRDGTAFTLKKSTSVPNLWTGIAKGIAAGSYSTIKIVATDSSAAKNKDSVSIKIKYDNDKSGPVIKLITPTKDSVTTNSSSYSIVLKITDLSGVLSVNGTAGTASLKGISDTDSTWKINIDNLENNKTTVVVLSATDSSLKANKTIDTVYIRSEIVNGYTIKFDKNDSAATGTMIDQTINSGDSAKLSANAFVKDGSTFGGWMITSAGSTIAYADGAMFKMGTADVILYAKWIKKATFALSITATNGTVTKSPNAAAYDSGSTVGLKAKANTGYKFDNWSGDVTGTIDSITVVVNKKINVTANFSPVVYTVTFRSNGATYSEAMVNNNALVTEPSVPNQGIRYELGVWYTFAGWYTSETYETNWNFLTDKVTKDMTLFAQWLKSVFITYEPNGASSGSAPAKQTKIWDVALTLATNSGNLAKTGSTFSGWNTAADGTGTDYTQGANYTVNEPLTLFAKWNPVFTVTYNANKGSGTVPFDNNKYQNGQVVTVLGAGSLGRTNYTFAGWNTQADTLGTNVGVSFSMGSANVILYAKWRMNAPAISTHPISTTCPVNDSVTFSVVASGASLTYQWQKNNGDIAGATAASYTPPALTIADTAGAATYRCVVSNAGGNVTSNGATLSISTLTDADGNVYHQVKIGTQVWTMENLRVTKYTDNTAIPKDTSSSTWANATTPKYCYYNNTNNADSIKKFGALYNWYVIDPSNAKKIVPTGWHVPTDIEWYNLQNYLIANGYNWDGTKTGNKIAKSMASRTDWETSDVEGAIGNNMTINNRSGFTALGGGNRSNSGAFTDQHARGYWWSSTENDVSFSAGFFLDNSNVQLESNGYYYKWFGYAVRLVKNN